MQIHKCLFQFMQYMSDILFRLKKGQTKIRELLYQNKAQMREQDQKLQRIENKLNDLIDLIGNLNNKNSLICLENNQ